MKFTKFAATSALVIAALGISTGTGMAAPAGNPDIHYTANVVDKSVVVQTDAGSLAAEGDQFQVRDNHGKVVAGFPLSYLRDGLEYPIAAHIEGNRATLTPSTNPATAHPAPMLHDVASQADKDSALQAAYNEFGIATSIGTLVGTAIGIGGGCLLGAALGTPFLIVPGAIGGCLTGAALGAPLGAAAGLVAVGGISGVLVAVEYFNRLNAPAAP
ncbi:hypothetical protein [Nocardia africana]|uniref:DUF8020 domain-containing protein n=1 Tax=Nocardia africana TaxID=134964 RepID=A0A378X4I6_9NOCA|nr:hypothetical protein [Nocardia africana]SUA47463.1 Uncharacterised protein [Nocardia africana]